MASDDELKDEELVDFEESSEPGGLDYIKPSALRAENILNEAKEREVEAAVALEPAEKDANGALQNQEAIVSTTAGLIHAVTIPENVFGVASCGSRRTGVVAQSINAESSCQGQPDCWSRKMEIAGIRRDANDTSGTAPGMHIDASGDHSETELAESRPRLVPSSKPDLEDGELDETAVPQNYALTAEEEVNDQISGREKKRKLESSGTERHIDGYFVKQVAETGDLAEKQHQSLGSDKAMEHFAGLAYAGGRGMGLRMIGLGQGSLAPGIMGPGRPLMPIGIGSLAQGLNPFGGLIQHGRPQVHLQEILAHEHLLRTHALQMVQETLANAMQSPLTRPLGAASFQPFVGYDFPGPRSHAPKHFPRSLPDLVMGPMGSFARGQRPNLPAGRSGVPSKVGGHADTSFYNGMGRQFGWPAGSGPSDAFKQGRGRGREFRTGLWGDVAESFGPMPGGLIPAGHPRAMMHSAAPLNLRHLNPDDTIYCQTSRVAIQAENDLLHNGFDARWKIEKERLLRNGLPNLRAPGNPMVRGNSSSGKESVKDNGKDGEIKPPRSLDSSKTGSLAARLGLPSQAQLAASSNPNSAEVPVASNVIKLHQPVRKSRILIVSGLPDDTPISTVVEVFEKLGKITDFKKSAKGDVFTISYSSETEAVTAKRNLHRSYIAGKQITVDYSYQ
ncbi:hypothetical protein GOP47_0009181 [Adiantum capillus-veneris]|uniref:RRM domain-containing protein n=1 Tax=Adiantum capillus-veneris TaxID=13818 RepID=A0A9D4UVR4_ADICA|nr:hypothetical protein GOP47_0009181 [Adiantum capillus-veneris]